jgi:wyosine [tRNA(Phe)-imidazoG37] synthetase (radical SAM superfamily)
VAKRIRPDRVQLNTCIRPGADSAARTVGRERLLELAELFTPEGEVIADYRDESGASDRQRAGRAEIIETLARHPATAEEVSAALRIGVEETTRLLDQMTGEGLVKRISPGHGRIHYVVNRRS